MIISRVGDVVDKDNSKKRAINWFKTSIFKENQDESILVDEQELAKSLDTESLSTMDKTEKIEKENDMLLLPRDKQDKVVQDLILSLENLIKDRQLIIYKNNSLEDQLSTANETINKMKKELIKKEQQLQEKNKEIRELENSLTNKQMSYEQLLEDYKEFQENANMEYERISAQLEAEMEKYKKFNEEAMEAQYKSMLKINELEETIRNLKIENQKYLQQYEKILNEKSELMKIINDFTERMSISLSPKIAATEEANS